MNTYWLLAAAAWLTFSLVNIGAIRYVERMKQHRDIGPSHYVLGMILGPIIWVVLILQAIVAGLREAFR